MSSTKDPKAAEPPALDEDDILTCCALRFDGSAFAEDTGFDAVAALDRCFESGEWPGSIEERFALFFLLQRDLCKWALIYEPKHGRYWRAFRSLFLTLAETAAPETYPIAEYRDRWDRKYRARFAECIAAVRQVHDACLYDDAAKPLV